VTLHDSATTWQIDKSNPLLVYRLTSNPPHNRKTFTRNTVFDIISALPQRAAVPGPRQGFPANQRVQSDEILVYGTGMYIYPTRRVPITQSTKFAAPPICRRPTFYPSFGSRSVAAKPCIGSPSFPSLMWDVCRATADRTRGTMACILAQLAQRARAVRL
jgi:hypothetical protein